MLTSILFAVFLPFVVGRDEVRLSTGEVRCGVRQVSGLFNKPRLPLGYSYITTVPKGACLLNVTENLNSENYIALKLNNGSYAINGDFAISTPGTYDISGDLFFYHRTSNHEFLTAKGPLLQAFDIMILYTQPNPSMKYEYFAPLLAYEINDENDKNNSSTSPKHYRRHHKIKRYFKSIRNEINAKHTDKTHNEEVLGQPNPNSVDTKKYMWTILSYTPCSRSCGGGYQTGKYRCSNINSMGLDREVSSVYCSGAAPFNRRRRCSQAKCPPRWRTTAWSECPTCGPANRSRIVGCVQDNSKGIIKVSDFKCTEPVPKTLDICHIPNCDGHNKIFREVDFTHGNRSTSQISYFKDGPVYPFSVNTSYTDVAPSKQMTLVGNWLFTEWSKCVGWCIGGGIETRGVRCADPSGCIDPPVTARTCEPQSPCDPLEGQWFTGEWSTCSSQCNGKQIRGVICVGSSSRRLSDSACKEKPRPDNERACGNDAPCDPAWYIGDWNKCEGTCGTNGTQRRTVWCARGDNGIPSNDCEIPKPNDERTCIVDTCKAVAGNANKLVPEEGPKMSDNEISSQTDTTDNPVEVTEAVCEDKLRNCMLAVQARLCHYKYYTEYCCQSCKGRP